MPASSSTSCFVTAKFRTTTRSGLGSAPAARRVTSTSVCAQPIAKAPSASRPSAQRREAGCGGPACSLLRPGGAADEEFRPATLAWGRSALGGAATAVAACRQARLRAGSRAAERSKRWRRLLARCFLWLAGWEAEGSRPTARCCVLIAAPHTSNWDLAFLLALRRDLRRAHLVDGQARALPPPLGWLMRATGGIAIDRSQRGRHGRAGRADASRARAARARRPRRRDTRLRQPLEVRLLPHRPRRRTCRSCSATSTTRRRRGGFGPAIEPTGDIAADMDEIRAFYADKTARFPEDFGEVRLKEEGTG